jgi:hypothetical protein
MLPLITYPLALAGLAAVPALVAIYLLRNRFRRQPVSSLMLWRDAREAREGGTKVRRLHLPLVFFLELIALVLLALAATSPQVRMSQGTRPLVVVLDDSFSMTAGGADSPRNRALDALRRELRRNPPYSIRFILAGDRPQVLGEAVRTSNEAMTVADTWRCRSSSAHLDEAIALGGELGGELALLLVLTDHAPPEKSVPDKGRLRWWSFGRPRGNVAIVTAARTNRDGVDRCLLEVANLSEEDRSVTLVVQAAGRTRTLSRRALPLAAGEAQRVILQPAAGTGALIARIDDDELALDNEVRMEPPSQRRVRVDLHVLDRRLRDPLNKAIRAAGNAVVDAKEPEVVFTDRATRPAVGPATWVVYLISEKDATAYTGPYVLDRTHPLTEGLALRGVIWGAGKKPTLDGAPVVMAGNVPLVADSEQNVTGGGTRHEVRIRFNPLLSTLHDSPDWPILVWNVLTWRAAALPGPARSNVRLGEQVVVHLPGYRDHVELARPGEKARTVSVKGRQLALRPDEVGLYRVSDDKTTYRFAVNALDRDESDLRHAVTGDWGSWLDETTLRLEYRPIAWVLLLVVLGVTTLHLWLVAPGAGGRKVQMSNDKSQTNINAQNPTSGAPRSLL